MSQTLTDKQKMFIEYFSQTGNATQSAIKAGYSEKTAEQQGYELKNKLQSQIESATKKLLGSAEELKAELDHLLNNMKIIKLTDPNDGGSSLN